MTEYGWMIEISREAIENVSNYESTFDVHKMALDKLYSEAPNAVVTNEKKREMRYRLVECQGCEYAIEDGEHFEHYDRVFSGVTDENWNGVRVEWIFQVEGQHEPV